MMRVRALEFRREFGESRPVAAGRFMERCGEAQPFLAGEAAHRGLELLAMAIGQIVTQVSIDQRFHPNLRWIGIAVLLCGSTRFTGYLRFVQEQMYLQLLLQEGLANFWRHDQHAQCGGANVAVNTRTSACPLGATKR
jgi:hypothetical protein